jgi:hypothetical protein
VLQYIFFMGLSNSSLADENHNGVFLVRNAKSGTYLEISLTTQPSSLREQVTGPLSANIRLQVESEESLRFNPEGKQSAAKHKLDGY